MPCALDEKQTLSVPWRTLDSGMSVYTSVSPI
jgi:hypothetical protein